MCYDAVMTEKPETQVIADKLKSLFPGGTPQCSHFRQEAQEIWNDLLEYWKTRAGGKVTEFEDGVKQVTEPTPTETLYKVLANDSPFLDGASAVHHHDSVPDHSSRTFPLPPDFNEKLKQSDDVADYEDYMNRRVEALAEEIADLSFTPFFNEKEKEKLGKLSDKLINLAIKRQEREHPEW